MLAEIMFIFIKMAVPSGLDVKSISSDKLAGLIDNLVFGILKFISGKG